MNKTVILSALLAVSLLSAVSCSYREYAPADYPETTIYQPLAVDGVLYINTPTPDGTLSPTPGQPEQYSIDEAAGELVVNMGVVQSGVVRKTFTVDIELDNSAVNSLILDGSLGPSTLPLPASAFTFPSQIMMHEDSSSASFQLRIKLDTLLDPEYEGKMLATAVTVRTSAVEVNRELATVVICIDPEFLYDIVL